ncbi:hypothetical protein D9M68_854620 [compost metagenome]
MEGVCRQTFHRAATFGATDRRAPAVHCECLGDSLGQRPGCIAPEVLAVVGAVHVLDIVHPFHGLGFRPIGQTQKEMRQDQGDVARVFALAEGAPFDQLLTLENL